eukprot:610751-Hanusia_phi.AAC.3
MSPEVGLHPIVSPGGTPGCGERGGARGVRQVCSSRSLITPPKRGRNGGGDAGVVGGTFPGLGSRFWRELK